MSLYTSDFSRLLAGHEARVVESIVEQQYARQPELAARYGEIGRVKCREDAAYHLSYLNQALIFENPALFADYVAWVKVVLTQRNIPLADLELNLRIIGEVLQEHLPEDLGETASTYIASALEQLADGEVELPAFVDGQDELSLLAQQYLGALLRLERHVASALILDAVEAGADVKEIYLSVFQPVQYELGRLWQMNHITVAQEHYCTAATQLIMSQLYPYIFSGNKEKGMVVAACIGTELHEIGVRMVADFFEMDGWDTLYLGANTPLPAIVRTLHEQKADLLCLSATMTYHVPRVADVIQAVRANAQLDQVKILVGGYPFKVAPNLWQQVGAHGFGANAVEAVAIATQLTSGKGRM
jgi:MerR family transcriptional regulator, light-induced transcriptional regulator